MSSLLDRHGASPPTAPPPADPAPLRWRVQLQFEARREFAPPRPDRPGTTPAPEPPGQRALRVAALLLGLALALLIGSTLLLDRFPTRVRVAVSGQSAAVAVGGTTRAVALAHPITAIRFPPANPNQREYAIDGSDSVNNATFDPDYFARVADAPYPRFQAWLRDESSYSTWRNLLVRNEDEDVILRQPRPAEGEALGLPPRFEVLVDLHRIEVPRSIEFLDASGGVVRLDINRNDKYARVVRTGPDATEETLVRWYFTREWQPALASVLHLLMRACAFGLLLVLLLLPLTLLLPARVRLTPGRRTLAVGVGLAAVVAFAASAYAGFALFDMEPHILDARGYYFQAKTFAAGLLYAPLPPSREAFDVPFTVYHEGKWFSMYTPGTALVLALGVKAGAAWLVEPLLAAGGVLLVHAAARRQFGARTALLAAILMATSPFLHLQAGSFMSHVPGMFWGAALLYCAVRYDERRAFGWAVAGATALGWLFLTRELSAIVYAATVGLYLAWRAIGAAWRQPGERARYARDAAGVLACLAVFAGAYLLYNRALTGSPTLLPRVLFDERENRYGFGDGIGFYGRHTLGGGLVNADEMLTSLGITLFGWPFHAALALPALPFLLRRARRWDRVNGAVVAGFVLAYVGLYYHGITYGPRYYLDALPALVPLAARGFVALAETLAALAGDWGRSRPRPRAELAALLLGLALLLANATYFWPQQPRLYGWLSNRPGIGRVTLGDFIERRPAGRVATLPNALVITDDRGLMEILGPLNCPRLDCATIFAFAADEAAEGALRAAFPGRTVYHVRDEAGVLTLDPPRAIVAPPAP